MANMQNDIFQVFVNGDGGDGQSFKKKIAKLISQ
jgi:hypothetical protein